MTHLHILSALVICAGIVIVYGENCGKSLLFRKQSNDIQAFIKTTEVIPNFLTRPGCKSDKECIVHCSMICQRYNCTVYARYKGSCLVHHYNLTGDLYMKNVDELWAPDGLNIVKGML